jgi:ATP-dependent Lhr-like helicase
MSRTSGAGVILINGNLVAFLRRRSQEIQVFLPEAEPLRSRFARELAKKLAELAIRRQGRKSGLLIGTINGEPAREHFLARFIEESGFVNTAVGFQMRRMAPAAVPASNAATVDSELDDGNDNDDDNSEDEAGPIDTQSPHHKNSETA